MLLLTDARRDARVSRAGELVLLADQDRPGWDRAKIAEGEALLLRALAAHRPGTYQLQAAIAACHAAARSAADTDWPQIAALYTELLRYEPTPVTAANRAAAVAMAEGPAAGLALLDEAGADPRLARWPQLHIARAELLRRLGRARRRGPRVPCGAGDGAGRAGAGLHPRPPPRAQRRAAGSGTGRRRMPETIIRNANLADYPGIAAVAVATGQDEEWAGADPAYLDYLMDCGRVVVATSAGAVTGFGATRRIGDGRGRGQRALRPVRPSRRSTGAAPAGPCWPSCGGTSRAG